MNSVPISRASILWLEFDTDRALNVGGVYLVAQKQLQLPYYG